MSLRPNLLGLIALLAASVLAADVLLPRSVAVSGLYVLPVLLSLWLGDRRLTRGTALVVSCAVLLGGLLTTPSGPLIAGLANRAVALFAVWATTLLGHLRMDVETELRRNRETTSTTLASIPEGVITTDARGLVTFLNSAAGRILGWTEAEAAGKPLASILQNRKASGESLPSDLLPTHGKGIVRHRDGSRLVLEAGTADIPDPERPGVSFGRVVVFRDITARSAREEAVEALAYRDPLTGLANRTSFDDRLELELARAQRGENKLGLLFLDLDSFKDVNDTLGHAAGDQLLIAISRRLRDALREEDTIARLGGDEFTVLLPGLNTISDAEIVAEKVLEALAPAHVIDGHEVLARPSLGLALYPDDLGTLEGAERRTEGTLLLRAADAAMYASKGEGGGRWSRCSTTRV